MAGITLTVEGASVLSKKIGDFAVHITDLSESMKETGNYLTGFFSGEVFASRGGVIGHSWPSLNPKYAVWKAQHFPGRPPLIRSGLMNRSFKSDAKSLSVRIFNPTPYFAEHQEGSGRLPARVMMDIDQTRITVIANIIARDIVAQSKAAGL